MSKTLREPSPFLKPNSFLTKALLLGLMMGASETWIMAANVPLNLPVCEQTQDKNQVTVNGIVKDAESGEPMIGVNIIAVKGEKIYQGAVTDIKGEFTFTFPKGMKLQFSFVGYEMQVIDPVVGKPMLITMKENTAAMGEVVVNGFFTRSKQTYTGSATTITADQLLQVSSTNILQALATLDPGMNISQNNAAGSNPNSIPDLVIRSTTSLSTNPNETGLNSPLIVIDGVESTLQDLYDIDMHDIDKVNILKDASATALYGENAANGVIVIERKRVSQSPVRVRYTFTPEMSFADLSSYDLCNASQKLELERRARLYNVDKNLSPDESVLTKEYYDKLAMVSRGIDTDWISKPVRNSFSHNHSVSISGRGSGLDYNITGNYSSNKGVMKGDARDRYGMNVFLSYRAISKLILTLRASHEQVKVENSKYGSFENYTQANPYDSPFDDMGNYRPFLSYNANNPLYEASLSSFSGSETRKQTLSLNARYNFKPTLYLTAQGSYTTSRGTSDDYISPKSNIFANTTQLSQKGSYMLGNNGLEEWNGKIVGNYIQNFDDDGTILTVNVGGEIKKTTSWNKSLSATGFLSDEMKDISYAISYPEGGKPSGHEDLATSMGFFAAANFVWKNRYIVDGSYRISGSSKFGANNQYAPFWSVGGGYNLHNEKFINDLGWVNTLRLRGSYGYTGSVKFNSYQAVSTYKYNSNFVHLGGVGAYPWTMANPDLTWQTTKKFNIGLTSAFWNERINFNLDYYNEITDDMLVDLSLPPSCGALSVKNNLGSQKSNGIEFYLWSRVIESKDWEWNLSVNGLHSKTKIRDISNGLKRMNDMNATNNFTAVPKFQYREGESPTAIYAVRSAGIDPASGKEIFIKKDGTYTYKYNAQDQVSVGDTNPDLQGSFSSFLRWKQFGLNINFSYRFGADVYNFTRAAKVENIDPKKNVDVRAFTDRWTKPGDVVPYLDIAMDGGKSFVYTDRFVERDNELWLSNVSLQYNVPDNKVQRFGIQKMYVSLGAEDLFRLNTVKYERGTSYPYSRSVNLALSVTF